MNNKLMLIPTVIINKNIVYDIFKFNQMTAPYGLSLTTQDALDLARTHEEALKRNGRIEFTSGTMQKLIRAFCSSPFITQNNYAETLNDLVEIFYYFKNESEDELSDDELILLMRKYFNENCRGAIELLQARELETLAHNIRFGLYDWRNSGHFLDQEADDE